MINGLYNSASGMNAELVQQDVVANNLANANTVGFKKDDTIFSAFPNVLVSRIHDKMNPAGLPGFLAPQDGQPLGIVGHGVDTHAIVTNFSEGSSKRTDGKLDLALHGDVLFTVEKADGTTAYTRAGNFTQNGQGQLTTQAGDLVMGVGSRPIQVDGSEVVVDSKGRFMVDGNDAGTLLLEAWDPKAMEKEGESLYVKNEPDIHAVDESPAPAATVSQGYLEDSNTSVVNEMVNMIVVSRAYEANQKAIQVQDSSLSEVINQVGKPV
jgi:flagellar basal-body rod protein FlgF